MANADESDATARQRRIHDLEVMTNFNIRASQYAQGTPVQLNLKKNPNMNGKFGIIIDQNGEEGRLKVQLDGTNQIVQVKKKYVLTACYEPTPAEIARILTTEAANAGFNLPDAAPLESAAIARDMLAADPENQLLQSVLAMMNQTDAVPLDV